MYGDVVMAQRAPPQNERKAHVAAIREGDVELPSAPCDDNGRVDHDTRLGRAAGVGDARFCEHRKRQATRRHTGYIWAAKPHPFLLIVVKRFNFNCVQCGGFCAGINLDGKIRQA